VSAAQIIDVGDDGKFFLSWTHMGFRLLAMKNGSSFSFSRKKIETPASLLQFSEYGAYRYYGYDYDYYRYGKRTLFLVSKKKVCAAQAAF
jgi:hypothetical protein